MISLFLQKEKKWFPCLLSKWLFKSTSLGPVHLFLISLLTRSFISVIEPWIERNWPAFHRYERRLCPLRPIRTAPYNSTCVLETSFLHWWTNLLPCRLHKSVESHMSRKRNEYDVMTHRRSVELAGMFERIHSNRIGDQTIYPLSNHNRVPVVSSHSGIRRGM